MYVGECCETKERHLRNLSLSSVYEIYDSILEEWHWRKFSSKINDSILEEENECIYIEANILWKDQRKWRVSLKHSKSMTVNVLTGSLQFHQIKKKNIETSY